MKKADFAAASVTMKEKRLPLTPSMAFLGATTFSTMTFRITTLSIMTRDAFDECHYAESHNQVYNAMCHYAVCRYTECRGAISLQGLLFSPLKPESQLCMRHNQPSLSLSQKSVAALKSSPFSFL